MPAVTQRLSGMTADISYSLGETVDRTVVVGQVHIEEGHSMSLGGGNKMGNAISSSASLLSSVCSVSFSDAAK